MRSNRLAIFALAVLSAAPAAAQDHVWTGDRPDGVAPVGILGDRVLEPGDLEVRYLFSRMKYEGVQIGTEQVAPISVLDLYATTPFEATYMAHDLVVAYGVTDRIGVLANLSFQDRSRGIATEEVFTTTEASGIGDAYIEAQAEFYRQGAIRAHLSAGAEIPLGSIDQEDDLLDLASQPLPYTMQPGSGTFAFVPGITAQIQNDRGSVGAQVKARIRVGTNDRDYQLGDEVDASMWAALRLNRFFSVSSGIQVHNFGTIEGADPALDMARDPAEDPFFSGGRRVDVPLGLNFVPAEGPLAGQRINVEFFWPVHQDYEWYQQRADWGFRLGWQTIF